MKVYCRDCRWYRRPVGEIYVTLSTIVGLLLFVAVVSGWIGFVIGLVVCGFAFVMARFSGLERSCRRGIGRKVVENYPSHRKVYLESLGSWELNRNNDCKYFEKRGVKGEKDKGEQE